MKNALAIISIAALGVSPAAAQTSVQLPLSGTLAKECAISAVLNGPFDALDLTDLTEQGAESISVNCNYGGTASVELASDNAGELRSGANGVAYTVSISGNLLNDASLATPQTITNWPATATTDQTRGISIKLANAATFAGTYTDTITATVTPN